MSTDNYDVIETAIEIGGDGVYFNISNELYACMWIINKCLKSMVITITNTISIFLFHLSNLTNKQILNELD